jgi:hypothetical protein
MEMARSSEWVIAGDTSVLYNGTLSLYMVQV